LYGVGAWLNGHRIACSRTLTLDEAVIATGFAARADAFDPSYIPMLQEAMRGARSIRRLGASALGLAWTACGRLDGYWEMGLAPWNVAAGTLILREAGGLCNDIHTVDAWPIGGCVVAGNPEIGHALHAMLAPHLNPHPQ
jgi:myo-inositol-1(or 4)-monophosphatase